MKLVHIPGAHQCDNDQDGADALGDESAYGNASHAHMSADDENKIQDNV